MMKAIQSVVLIASLLFCCSISGQEASGLESIFEKYSGNREFTVIEVTKGLFDLLAKIEMDDPELAEMQHAVAGLERLRVISLSANENNADARAKFYNDISKNIPESELNELMTVKEKDTDIRFLARYRESVISEILMTLNGKDETVLLSLTGKIDLKHLSNISGVLDLQGMKYLEKLKPENVE